MGFRAGPGFFGGPGQRFSDGPEPPVADLLAGFRAGVLPGGPVDGVLPARSGFLDRRLRFGPRVAFSFFQERALVPVRTQPGAGPGGQGDGPPLAEDLYRP